MINGLGQPAQLLVVGASSEIVAATVRSIVARGGVERALLTARDRDALRALRGELEAHGAEVTTASWDAAAGPQSCAGLVEQAWEPGDVDVVLIGVGELPRQAELEQDPARLASLVQTNLTGPACVALHAARRLRRQGHGVLVILSSVAAERARADNFAYAATKAGLDQLASGLGDSLDADGVRVLVVRPGFVHTRMTAGLDPAPLATTPQRVGADIARNIWAGRSGTVYSPPALRAVMAVLRLMPRPLWRSVSRGR
jgi:decaprenylphospho-beta-D-erythro-pentofuranosid-2-ulose 2-reductase